jgi:APA family basic amino acid/polyamine antiporter
MPLKRELGFWQLTLMGVGVIVGAGIYVLVGIAGAQAGNALWLSFVISGIIAACLALDYAELSSMLPKAGSSYYFSKEAFGSRRLSFVLGWTTIATFIVSSAAVALGFGTYFSTLFPSVSASAAAVGLVVVLALVNYFSLKYASEFNEIFTLLEVAGLIAVIAFGLGILNPAFALDFSKISFESPNGFQGILSASILAFFAYLGFETLAAEAEETKRVRKTLPKAILTSIAICIVLYVLAALAFTNVMSFDEIISATESAKGPLAIAAGKAGGALLLGALGIIALFSTANTVLIMMLGSSRVIYGMAEDFAVPKIFLKTSRYSTPYYAIAVASLLTALIASTGQLRLVAEITVMGMFVVFFLDNAAVIVLRKKEPNAERGFRIPVNFKNVPLTSAVVGIALIGIAANEFYKNPVLLYGVLAILASGLVVYQLEKNSSLDVETKNVKRKKKKREE